jgi:polyisoprenoid-binding protein YceI
VAADARTTDPALRERLADGSLAGEWSLDPSRSSVALRARAIWGIVPVKGTFGEVSGEAVISAAGEISGTIRVSSASIDTKVRKRDAHLRSADFFESDAYPDIVFTVRQVQLASEGATVTGTLQVRDAARPLSFPAAISAAGDDAVQLDAEVGVDRSDFGLTWKKNGATSMTNTLTVRAVFTRR